MKIRPIFNWLLVLSAFFAHPVTFLTPVHAVQSARRGSSGEALSGAAASKHTKLIFGPTIYSSMSTSPGYCDAEMQNALKGGHSSMASPQVVRSRS